MVMRRTVLRATLVAYVAVVTAPVATVLPGGTWPLFAAGLAVGAVLGTVLTGRIDAAAWLSTVPRGAAGLVLALLWLVPTVRAGTIATPWVLGAVAVVPWAIAVLAAAHCRMRDRVEAAETLAAFRARPAPTQRRHLTVAAGVLVAASVVGGVALVAVGGGLDDASTLSWLPASLSVFVLLLGDHDEREITVTDTGLVVQSHLHEWDTIADYEVTEEALVFSRTDWYRSSFGFDVAGIDDLDAATTAIDDGLRRRPRRRRRPPRARPRAAARRPRSRRRPACTVRCRWGGRAPRSRRRR